MTTYKKLTATQFYYSKHLNLKTKLFNNSLTLSSSIPSNNINKEIINNNILIMKNFLKHIINTEFQIPDNLTFPQTFKENLSSYRKHLISLIKSYPITN